MVDATTRLHRNERVVFRNLPDGAVLLHLDTAAYHGVNEVGAAIWELMASGPTFGELIEQLRGKLEDPPDDLEGDVTEYVEGLAERGLVQVGDESPAESVD